MTSSLCDAVNSRHIAELHQNRSWRLAYMGLRVAILNLHSEFVLKVFVLVYFSFQIRLRDVNYLVIDELADDTWIQVVMIFNREPHAALRVYISGEEKHGKPKRPYNTDNREISSGDVVIGRRYVEEDKKYCSTMVDELMLWNRSLTSQEAEYIISLY